MSDAGRYPPHFGLRGRLVEYLLRAGERASVAEYLEKSAERYLPERDRLLKDAAQIRAGVMPLSYQYAEARRQRQAGGLWTLRRDLAGIAHGSKFRLITGTQRNDQLPSTSRMVERLQRTYG